MAVDNSVQGPGPGELPPPWGTGPALPDSVLRTRVATGGWNHLTAALGQTVPTYLMYARRFNNQTRLRLGQK